MGTGYTYQIEKGQSFKDFVWGCARAFGVDGIKQPSAADHHKSALYNARVTLKALQNRTPQAWESDLAAFNRGQIERLAEANANDKALKSKYEVMLAAVKAWEAPTADHVNLKQFMVTQIADSIRCDCRGDNDEYYPEFMGGVEAYKTLKLKRAQGDVEYHEEALHKEEEENRRHKTFVEALVLSVGAP